MLHKRVRNLISCRCCCRFPNTLLSFWHWHQRQRTLSQSFLLWCRGFDWNCWAHNTFLWKQRNTLSEIDLLCCQEPGASPTILMNLHDLHNDYTYQEKVSKPSLLLCLWNMGSDSVLSLLLRLPICEMKCVYFWTANFRPLPLFRRKLIKCAIIVQWIA